MKSYYLHLQSVNNKIQIKFRIISNMSSLPNYSKEPLVAADKTMPPMKRKAVESNPPTSNPSLTSFGFYMKLKKHPFGSPRTNDSHIITKYANDKSYFIKDITSMKESFCTLENSAAKL